MKIEIPKISFDRKRKNLGRGAAENANLEILEAIFEGGLGFNHTLKFQNCPFRAFFLPAAAFYLNLHLRFTATKNQLER